jgi:hypothetical protein
MLAPITRCFIEFGSRFPRYLLVQETREIQKPTPFAQLLLKPARAVSGLHALAGWGEKPIKLWEPVSRGALVHEMARLSTFEAKEG